MSQIEMKLCKDSWCRKLKPLDQFIDERNGKETKVCLKCRINLRAIRKRMKERAPDYYKEVYAERSKKHYYKNQDKMIEQSKKYYEKNKDKLMEKGKVKITCECGSVVSKYNLCNHRKTKKHHKWLETQ